MAAACAPILRAIFLAEPAPGPESRRAVLVTRPEPGASDTAARLRELGYEPVIAPLLVVEAVPARMPSADAVQAVLISSAQAIPALPLAMHGVPVLAVGDATARRAVADGFVNVRSAGADAAVLAELVARSCDPHGKPLLLATGQGQGMRLAGALRERGFRVLRRVAYHARPVSTLPDAAGSAISSGRLEAALFYSGETARCFARLLPPECAAALADVLAIAISARAAKPLRSLNWRALRVAIHPSQDAVLAQLT